MDVTWGEEDRNRRGWAAQLRSAFLLGRGRPFGEGRNALPDGRATDWLVGEVRFTGGWFDRSMTVAVLLGRERALVKVATRSLTVALRIGWMVG